MKPLEDIIRFSFILAITGGHIYSDHDRILPFLSVSLMDLVFQYFTRMHFWVQKNEKSTSSLSELIKYQLLVYFINDLQQKKTIKN